MGYLKAVYLFDCVGDIPLAHPFGIHAQNLVLDPAVFGFLYLPCWISRSCPYIHFAGCLYFWRLAHSIHNQDGCPFPPEALPQTWGRKYPVARPASLLSLSACTAPGSLSRWLGSPRSVRPSSGPFGLFPFLSCPFCNVPPFYTKIKCISRLPIYLHTLLYTFFI